uniref:Coiled-coil domain-containing protein 176 n=1 Tax=Elaeophora elaphi TaxID=1147741 RepID=A0A0R3RLT1_9BILA
LIFQKLNANFQESFSLLEQQFNNSTQQINELKEKSERDRENMCRLKRDFKQTKKTLTEFRKRIKKKNHTIKSILHAKRVAEAKLRETLLKHEREVKRSSELEDGMKSLESTVQELKLKLEEMEHLCTDSKRRLAIHSEAASLAYRQIHEANKRATELTEKNQQIHMQYMTASLEMVQFKEDHSEAKEQLKQIILAGVKHSEELQVLKQVMQTEMASIKNVVNANYSFLTQMENLVSTVKCENLTIEEKARKLEEVKKNLEEQMQHSNAVICSQHQELIVYDTNYTIQNEKITMLKIKDQLGTTKNFTTMFQNQVEQYKQIVQLFINQTVEFQDEMRCMLTSIIESLRLICEKNKISPEVVGLDVKPNNALVSKGSLQLIYEKSEVSPEVIGLDIKPNSALESKASNRKPRKPSTRGRRVQRNAVPVTMVRVEDENLADLPGPSNVEYYHRDQANIQSFCDDTDEPGTKSRTDGKMRAQC